MSLVYTFSSRLVLWHPLAWWEWWVVAFMTSFNTCKKRTYMTFILQITHVLSSDSSGQKFLVFFALKVRVTDSKDDPSDTEVTMNTVVLEVYHSVYTWCFIKQDFKSSPLIYFCRVEGSWICLAWWEKWWETWWVSSNFSFAECNYEVSSDSTPSDHLLLFSSLRKECPAHQTVRHFPLQQWSPTPPQTQGLLKFISRPVKREQALEGWE